MPAGEGCGGLGGVAAVLRLLAHVAVVVVTLLVIPLTDKEKLSHCTQHAQDCSSPGVGVDAGAAL